MKKRVKIFFYSFEERALNFIAILFLCLSMSIGFFVEFGMGEIPCSLCFLQRIAIMGIAFCLYLNLFFGAQPRHYGFGLIWALLGISVALRHIALNVCQPVTSDAFVFASCRIYTWSFLTFFFSILGIALLLCFHKKPSLLPTRQNKGSLVYGTAALLLVMLVLGFFSVLQKQGWEF